MKQRFQFSIRSLLVLMVVVGPLLGWYGPVAGDKLREIWTPKSSPRVRTGLGLPVLLKPQQPLGTFQEELDKQDEERTLMIALMEQEESDRVRRQVHGSLDAHANGTIVVLQDRCLQMHRQESSVNE